MPIADYEVLDPRFARLFNATAHVEKLFTGCLWAEGPAYFAAGRYLVWSDIPNNRMLRYDETDGQVSVFRQPVGQFQRQYRRSPGPAGHLRAFRPPRQPHRVRRLGHHASPTATRASG